MTAHALFSSLAHFLSNQTRKIRSQLEVVSVVELGAMVRCAILHLCTNFAIGTVCVPLQLQSYPK